MSSLFGAFSKKPLSPRPSTNTAEEKEDAHDRKRAGSSSNKKKGKNQSELLVPSLSEDLDRDSSSDDEHGSHTSSSSFPQFQSQSIFYFF
jgi:hypothetical protein